ncbi:hypothetical protein JCM8208_001101 [Rhodotorula glutinis]
MEADILAAWTSHADPPHQAPRAIAKAWDTVVTLLDPHQDWKVRMGSHFDPPRAATDAFRLLEASSLTDDLLNNYLEAMRDAFVIVRAEINDHLDHFEAEPSPQAQFDIMLALLHCIGTWITRYQEPVAVLWSSNSYALTAFRKTFLASLHFILPPRFAPALRSFLRTLLACPSPSEVGAPSYRRAIPTLITLLDRYDPLLFGLIYEQIEAKVTGDARGAYTHKQLESLLKWLNGTDVTGPNAGVMGLISGIYDFGAEGNVGQEEARKFLKPTLSRFEYHVHKVLCQLRTTEMFDMILAFPASQPALEDLKTCLLKTEQRTLLVTRLCEQLARRLLHPGADTERIITTYIATIRCLRVVDPPGVLLSRVAEPIRQCLRARKDTIRCIVQSLIEPGNPLFEELVNSSARLVSDARDEAENFNDPKWTPDPVDAPDHFRKGKGADVIQLLVSIYDTKDVFVKELQVLLAQRLLAIRDYALEAEVKNVETLKGRFGEQALQGCDVMIKDLQDSRRIDEAVHQQIPDIPLHATVVSRLFWPSFQPAPLKLPGQIGRAQAAYDRTFSTAKRDKKLRWLPQLGSVNLTLDLRDRSITVDATPLQAAIIELFSSQDTWSSDALVTELRVPDAATVRNALYFWNNLGVLRSLPDDDLWRLVEEVDEREGGATEGAAHVVEEEKEAVQSVEAQRVEQMRVFWQYIQGMLTNLGALPLSRIHSTLNMLAPGYKGRTTDELTALLEAVAADGLVTKTPKGSWKIVK